MEYHHFKMDSLTNIIRIMERGCYMASIDIKDAYFSFAINSHDQKFLCFQWENCTYQFTCLPNGLSSAPRNLKVPLTLKTKTLKSTIVTVTQTRPYLIGSLR